VDTSLSQSISPEQFAALLASGEMPLLLDVRRDERFDQSPRMLPRAQRCAPQQVAKLAATQGPGQAIVYCVHGLEIGEQAAAELRAAGWHARFLQGGIDGWIERGGPSLRKRPELGVDGTGGSRWITRARPKIDRIACPWLIRRFIDPTAQFFYVPEAEVFAQAERLGAVPFDIEGAPISHEWERCSFDALLKAFELREPALETLAVIVRGADTARQDIAPQAAGLLAISLGLSQLHADEDHAMLAAALPVYDALYAWCRYAQGERHSWKAHAPVKAAQ